MKQFESLHGRRVLLIGGAGFIGHNLALALKSHGAEVAVVDSLKVNNLLSLHDDLSAPAERKLYSLIIDDRLELLKRAGIPLFVADATNLAELSRVFAEFSPQAAVLLAAVSHASRANRDPATTLLHSNRSLENALEIARHGLDQFVFMSSSMVYGDFGGHSVTEDSPCDPIGIYGAVKLGGEKLIRSYARVFGLQSTIIRPSALYGERCISRRVGQVFIENAIRGRELVIRGDGLEQLDFTYIKDLVQGMMLALASDRAKGETFNVTYGQGRALLEVAELVRQAFPGVEIRHEERDALVPERGTLDVSKARELLGYSPEYAIERGFADYIGWYRDLFGRFDHAEIAHVEAQGNE